MAEPRTSTTSAAECPGETPVSAAAFARAQKAWEEERWDEAIAAAREAFDEGLRRLAARPAPPTQTVKYARQGLPRRPILRDITVLLADALYLGRRHRETLALLDEAEAAAVIAPDDPPALMVRGWIVLRHGDVEWVAEMTKELIARAPDLEPELHGQALHLAGMTAHERGATAAGRELLRDAVAIYRAAGDRRGLADALNAMGVIEANAFNLRDARAAVEESLRINREIGRHHRACLNLSNLCIFYYKLGLLRQAAEALDASEEQHGDSAPFYERLLRQLARAKLLLHQGKADEAAVIADESGRAAHHRKYVRESILSQEILGDAELIRGSWQEALVFYRRGLARAQRHARAGGLVPGLRRRLGEAWLRGGRLDRARAQLERAVAVASRCRELYEGAEARRLLAEVARRRRQFPRAYRHVRRAMALAREQGAGLAHGRSLLEAARIQHQWWRALGAGPRGSEDGLCERLGDLPSLMAGPAVSASPAPALSIQPALVRDAEHHEASRIAARIAAGFAARPVAVPVEHGLLRGHLEAAWSYAVEALHQFEELDFDPGRDEALLLMDNLRAHWQPPWVDSPAARVLEDGDETAFIARSPAMVRVRRMLKLAAEGDDPVLITGETGTGKELAARQLHVLGRRRGGPLVAVNCGAVPPTVFEREFFGHVEGAFTGAVAAGAGFCDQARGGTLFLDEVGEIPFALQAKLLRVLQEGTFRRLGDPDERRADLRVVAATNADLLDLVARGRFRSDLYFRLQIFEIRVPPLRERLQDIMALADLFTRRATGRELKLAELCDEGVVDALLGHSWPGNVRELEGLVRRLCVLIRKGGRIKPALLPAMMRRYSLPRAVVAEAHGGSRTGSPGNGSLRLADRVAAVERDAVREALTAASGNRTEAARLLGIGRGTLYRKIENLDIDYEGGLSKE